MNKDQKSPRRSRLPRAVAPSEQQVGRAPETHVDWADALSGIRASFDLLCTWPHPVRVDGRAIAGLPDALIPLDEVRQYLTSPGCPLEVSDGVWAHLAHRSRVDGPSWTVAAAGMALPMLCHVVKLLTVRFGDDRSDIASATVAGFLSGLAAIDVSGSRLFASLRWSAYRAGLAAVHAALAAPQPATPDWLTALALAGPARVPSHSRSRGRSRIPAHDHPRTGDPTTTSCPTDVAETAGTTDRMGALPVVGAFESAPPPAVVGHPDLVLARAVRDGILSFAEAAMIGATRLEALSIADAAAARGQSITAATVSRHRAERRLLRYLADPDLLTGQDQTPSIGPVRRLSSHSSSASRRRTRTRGSRSATDCSKSAGVPALMDPSRIRQGVSPAVTGIESPPAPADRANRPASALPGGSEPLAGALARGCVDSSRGDGSSAAGGDPIRSRTPSPRDLDPAWRTRHGGSATAAGPVPRAADVETAARSGAVSVVTR